jgi:uncharacterized Zn-finger protein
MVRVANRSPLGPRLSASKRQSEKARFMAEHVVPHFHNDPGVPAIEVGAKEFMCVGATPPYDHPHVFCDMGGDNEIVCPYCSTLYRFNAALDPHAAIPPVCALPLVAA